jgi:hypothetical protein
MGCYTNRQRRPCRNPMGTLAGTARSRAHGGALSRSLHALIDGPKSTAEGRHGIATHHNASTKAV